MSTLIQITPHPVTYNGALVFGCQLPFWINARMTGGNNGAVRYIIPYDSDQEDDEGAKRFAQLIREARA